MQRTEAWHRQRRGRLTASALGQALGLTPWGSAKRLAEQLRADSAPVDLDDAPKPKTAFKENVAMRWGTNNEPNGLLEYMVLSGASIEETGFHEHPSLDWFGGSPDGLVAEDGMVEIKCPYTRKCYAEFPPYYYPQINALLEITGRQWCDLFVWTPEGHRVWRVMANKHAFEVLLCHYTRFWAYVLNGHVPPNPSKEVLPLVRGWLLVDAAEITLDNAEHSMLASEEETCKYWN